MAIPLIPIASALLPLVADIAPPLVRFLVGDRGADTSEKVAETAENVTAAANKVADVVKSVTNTDVTTPEGVASVREQLQADPVLKERLSMELARVDVELERMELKREQARLADVQDARAKAIARREVGGDDLRGNLMLVAAFFAIIAIVALLILVKDIPPEVVGFVIGIGGMFARNIGSAFDFEFGSSRGSKSKDAKIETQLVALQQAATERVRDKQQELQEMKSFAARQNDLVQKADKIVKAVSTANKLRAVLKSS